MTKEAFHRKYNCVLKHVAKDLGLREYQVRSNKGGPAVMGEVILHAPKLYIMVLGQGVDDCQVMYRSCRGMKDYTGGRNRWMKLSVLERDYERALKAFQDAAEASGLEPRF